MIKIMCEEAGDLVIVDGTSRSIYFSTFQTYSFFPDGIYEEAFYDFYCLFFLILCLNIQICSSWWLLPDRPATWHCPKIAETRKSLWNNNWPNTNWLTHWHVLPFEFKWMIAVYLIETLYVQLQVSKSIDIFKW